MSQFNLYLERVQENRNYKYQDLELYDEDFKEIWSKVKKTGIFTALLLSLMMSSDKIEKKENLPEVLLQFKNLITQSSNYKFDQEQKKIIKSAFELKGGKITPDDIEDFLKILQKQKPDENKINNLTRALNNPNVLEYALNNNLGLNL